MTRDPSACLKVRPLPRRITPHPPPQTARHSHELCFSAFHPLFLSLLDYMDESQQRDEEDGIDVSTATALVNHVVRRYCGTASFNSVTSGKPLVEIVTLNY